MIEFNPDGSIKLPGQYQKKKEENEERMRRYRCMRIQKEIISFSSPKRCCLNMTLSQAISDERFVRNIYDDFAKDAAVPTRLEKKGDKEYTVEIGTDFRRCTDCTSLINRFREFLDGNILEDKGSCTFRGRQANFCEEDYFD